MTPSPDIVSRLRAWRHGSQVLSSNDLITEAADLISSQAERILELEQENERVWQERNVAYAKVKGWEATVYVEGLPLCAVPVGEWGPGEGGTASVPDITPKKLTDLLDRLQDLEAMRLRMRQRP